MKPPRVGIADVLRYTPDEHLFMREAIYLMSAILARTVSLNTNAQTITRLDSLYIFYYGGLRQVILEMNSRPSYKQEDEESR